MSRKTKAYAPTTPEALERREVPTRLGDFLAFGAFNKLIYHDKKPVAPTIGVLGDSLSDEYKSYAPDRSQARGWVELLAAKGRANFGAYSPTGRGEPRNDGFANNWARAEATTGDMLNVQLPGLLASVASGQVKYVSILIGDNDFGRFLAGAAANGGTPEALATQLAQVTASAIGNLDKTVTTLLAANPSVKLSVATIPDLAGTPVVARAATTPAAKLLVGAVSRAIGVYNTQIRVLALNPRVAVAEVAAGTEQLGGGGKSFAVGNQTIDLSTTGNDYHHFLLADGFHPGTVGQALIANQIVGALDTKFGAGIKYLSGAETLSLARSARRLR